MIVLQLCNKVPYPPVDGGSLAMLNMAELLIQKDIEVKMLCMETYKHPLPEQGFSEFMINQYQPQTVFVDTKIKPLNLLFNFFFSTQSYIFSRFKSKAFNNKLKTLLHHYQPDIVLLDSLFVGSTISTIKENSKAKIIYRAHNIEFEIWSNNSKRSSNYLKKIYLNIQSKRLRAEETKIINDVDGIITITADDLNFIRQIAPSKKLINIPFTIDISKYRAEPNFNKKALFFIGAMDWIPNLEGIKWFIRNVWDKVLIHHPETVLYIAGKAMPNELMNYKDKNIINMGLVDDAKEFMTIAPIMIAPIFSGGGLKIKMIEAMALKRIIISTSFAAKGINVKNNYDILMADSADMFVENINQCLSHPNEFALLCNNAYNKAATDFNTKIKADELEKFLSSVINVTETPIN